jgi:hypothetical protein
LLIGLLKGPKTITRLVCSVFGRLGSKKRSFYFISQIKELKC